MKLDLFPKVLWINLDRSSKRRLYMENLLNSFNLNHIRISAIDGKNEADLLTKCILNPKLTPAENACTVSHLNAMKFFVDEITDDQVIIFEDDVSFDFLPLIPYNWSDFMKTLPVDYEIIQLAITHETLITNMLVRTTPDLKYYCSSAYLIKKSAAIKILNIYSGTGKIDLSNQIFATADAMITQSVITYSIPIFTYQCSESTIHPYHLYNHQRAKAEQMKLWSNGKN